MITFRDATETDLPAIVALLADDTLGASRENPGPPLPSAYVTGFRRMMEDHGCIILASKDEEIVACLQLDILHGVSHIGATRAQVEGVRVASTHRGQGIGALLMHEAIRRARHAGCTTIQLTTNLARADAQRFYQRLGFTHSHAGLKLGL